MPNRTVCRIQFEMYLIISALCKARKGLLADAIMWSSTGKAEGKLVRITAIPIASPKLILPAWIIPYIKERNNHNTHNASQANDDSIGKSGSWDNLCSDEGTLTCAIPSQRWSCKTAWTSGVRSVPANAPHSAKKLWLYRIFCSGDDGCIQTAGICQHDFMTVLLVCHNSYLTTFTAAE